MSTDKHFRENEGDAVQSDGPGSPLVSPSPTASEDTASIRIAPAHTPGSCSWNGNEIVDARGVAVAGLAPNAPDEWGPLFAAAPDLLAVLTEIEGEPGARLPQALWTKLRAAISKATQQ